MRGRPITCCFTGHRPEKLPWGTDESDPGCTALKLKIYDAVESAYAEGLRHFICGMARGCDFYFDRPRALFLCIILITRVITAQSIITNVNNSLYVIIGTSTLHSIRQLA